jgi:bifunctional non-homologous end joining protein LigD
VDLLEHYRKKRKFDRTPEPQGSKGRRASASDKRFVVQKHDASQVHFDLRLEHDGVLKSWAVTRGPSLDPADKRLAVRVEDHPLEYGDFEGTIPAGQYGAGTVMLWDEGTWEPENDPGEGLAAGKLKFRLHGDRLSGGWALVRMRSDSGNRKKSRRENWLLIKERDDEAKTERTPLIARAKTSARSGRTMHEIASGGRSTKSPSQRGRRPVRKPGTTSGSSALPAFIAPQLCTLVETVPEGDGWLHEIKFDGYRAVSAIADGKVVIRTRKGLDWTDKFPSLASALADLPCRSALIDGEIAVADEGGATDFGALQSAIGQGGKGAGYYIFDLLSLDEEDLSGNPLLERKGRLESLLADLPKDGPLFYSDHVMGGGPAVFNEACDLKLEGVVSKRADVPYRSGRSHSWVKVKCRMGQEFVIVGWRPSKVKGRPFSSLLLAVMEDGKVSYRGRVGSGFGEAELKRVWAQLKTRKVKRAPAMGIPAAMARDACFVKPELVAEIAFRGWTGDGMVRQGSFKGLRTDKKPSEIVAERPAEEDEAVAERSGDSEETKSANAGAGNGSGDPAIAGVRLTHPDRVLYPEQGVTKRALAEYYLAVADLILPHLADRPVSLVRCPRGTTGECFFQKHASKGFPDELRKVRIREKSGANDYVYVDDAAGLVAATQMGVLELHIWGSHIDTLEKPDRMVFDLDPDASVAFAEVRTAALELRKRLEELGLRSFAMATGGKGVHVVVPLTPKRGWDELKDFAEAIARSFADEKPDRYLATASKSARKGRIFIDYLRNARGATAITPFSSRAKPGAPVAWPLSWKQLQGLKDAQPATVATAESLLKRRKKDPWAGYFDVDQLLPNL